MNYDSVDLKNFTAKFKYNETPEANTLKENYNFFIGSLLIFVFLLLPLHAYLAYTDVESVHVIFLLLEAVLVLIVLFYARIEVVFDKKKKEFRYYKKCLLGFLSSSISVSIPELEKFSVLHRIWGVTQKYTDRFSYFSLQNHLKKSKTPNTIFSSLTISNGAWIYIFQDLCQQNLQTGKFVAHLKKRELPFSATSSVAYYAKNFAMFWVFIFLFMLGTGLLFYFKNQDMDGLRTLFSLEVLAGQVGVSLFFSVFFGYLIKEK
ncbi:MAG: hypothetical protein WCP97_06400 [bacterium]